MLTVKMIKNQLGSPDGVACVEYAEGETYDFLSVAAVDLARVFIHEGWAEEVVEAGAEETAVPDLARPIDPELEVEEKQAPEPAENKQAPEPGSKAKASTKKKRGRHRR